MQASNVIIINKMKGINSRKKKRGKTVEIYLGMVGRESRWYGMPPKRGEKGKLWEDAVTLI